MSKGPIVNGKVYDWGDVKFILSRHLSFSMQSINWDHSQETKVSYGVGSSPIGHGQGLWSGSGKLSILTEEYQLMLTYMKGPKGNIFSFPPTNIIVSYAYEGKIPYVVTLEGIKFTKVNEKAGKGDTETVTELDFVITVDVLTMDADGNMCSSAGRI